jgi:hypothetical protein
MNFNSERARELGFSEDEIEEAELSVKMQDNYNEMVRNGVDQDGC